ncbi:hypothetical protein NDU88_000336 [Pleurodeles waltl]|uniref:Uncharacterized protein n=1 Tax=Pleurodeles waltl TaxID=8319 RepID=A0AAV7L827_PLEWA|nr:hypothetical protein NDU88_000336 [Pleurodeles waltl]
MRHTIPPVPKRPSRHRPSASSNLCLTPDLLLLSRSISSGGSAPQPSVAQRASARSSGVPPSLRPTWRHLFVAWVLGLVVPGLLFGPFHLSAACLCCEARRQRTKELRLGAWEHPTPTVPGSHGPAGAHQFQLCPLSPLSVGKHLCVSRVRVSALLARPASGPRLRGNSSLLPRLRTRGGRETLAKSKREKNTNVEKKEENKNRKTETKK